MKRTRLIDLGVASYVPVWRQQEELHNEIIAAKLRGEETGNCMIFVEHNHVYTLGKSGNEANMLVSAIQLQAAHAEFVKVNRGGDITYHGPGPHRVTNASVRQRNSQPHSEGEKPTYRYRWPITVWNRNS